MTIFVVDGVFSTSTAATTTADPSTYSTRTPTTTPAPPAPLGACCNPQGTDAAWRPLTCVDGVTADTCTFGGGTWLGALSQCSLASCPTSPPPADNATTAWVPRPDELACKLVWNPVCRPSLDQGCPYGYNDDWSCAPPVQPDCAFEEWRHRMAALWAAYYNGDTHVNVLFADLLGGQCKGRSSCT